MDTLKAEIHDLQTLLAEKDERLIELVEEQTLASSLAQELQGRPDQSFVRFWFILACIMVELVQAQASLFNSFALMNFVI